MNVEDALEAMVVAVVERDLFAEHPRDREFVLSVGEQWLEKGRISLAQGDHVVRLLKRAVETRPSLMALLGVSAADQDRLAQEKTYRVRPSESVKVWRNEIRWLGEGQVGLRFRPNGRLLEHVKGMAKAGLSGWPSRPGGFVRSDLVWIIPVNRLTVVPLTKLVTDYGFDIDEDSRQALLDVVEVMEGTRVSSTLDAPDLDKFLVQVADNPFIEDWLEVMAGGERVA